MSHIPPRIVVAGAVSAVAVVVLAVAWIVGSASTDTASSSSTTSTTTTIAPAPLDTLAPKKRIVLYLHEIEGLELKEIAYLVDSNAVTVRTRLFYARREFYRALGGQGAGPGPSAQDSSNDDDAPEVQA